MYKSRMYFKVELDAGEVLRKISVIILQKYGFQKVSKKFLALNTKFKMIKTLNCIFWPIGITGFLDK